MIKIRIKQLSALLDQLNRNIEKLDCYCVYDV